MGCVFNNNRTAFACWQALAEELDEKWVSDLCNCGVIFLLVTFTIL